LSRLIILPAVDVVDVAILLAPALPPVVVVVVVLEAVALLSLGRVDGVANSSP
jgi:ABC-type uncharacterized transport system YnjBCD permease subunit